ncbi:MAG: threonine synthase [Candidatus Hydrothermarchaeales archaeon]
MFGLRCIECGKTYSENEMVLTCECGGLLEVRFNLGEIHVERKTFEGRPSGVWRYKELLPVKDTSKVVTLEEGGTPLYKAGRLADELKVEQLYLKNEGANPTGSFKDRGMTVGVSKAIEFGFDTVGCASTGNTSASLSAYSGKAGLKCIVLLPVGKIAKGKLAQALLHGATVIGIRGNFDVALKLVVEASEKFGIYLLNSINPWRLEGQKTEGFEIAQQLKWQVPDWVIVPMGNCGNISAIWKGFKEFHELGLIDSLPKMVGIQAEGAAPVATAFKKGTDVIYVEQPETIATAIRIGAPVNAPKAMRALKDSGGSADATSDDEILKAQKLLARSEGIGVEPASAASVAGLIKLMDEGIIDRSDRIVCVTTGHALKDPEIIFSVSEEPVEIDPTIDELRRVLGK